MASEQANIFSEHRVFGQLQYYSEFYDSISYSTMGFLSQGTQAHINLDIYIFGSMAKTINSIKTILLKGHLNDAYALLRKYYDATIINIYSNLWLDDHFDIDNFVVSEIDSWRKGTKKLPQYREISEYIKKSPKLKRIAEIVSQNDQYKNIRERCNDHTHYNYYYYLLLNDNDIYIQDDWNKLLDRFLIDLTSIFIQHLSYILYLKDNYMSSSDYIDALEARLKPEENSQYQVAPFIQDMFDKIIKPARPDLFQVITELWQKTI